MAAFLRRIGLSAIIAIFAGATFIAGSMGRAAPPPASQPHKPTTRVSSAALGLSFDCPAGFDVGRCEKVPGDADRFFADAVVLVERSVAQRQRDPVDLHAMPPGRVPAISIHHTTHLHDIVRPTTRMVINGNAVCRLPYFPGPYGDQVFVYVLPRGGADEITIMAHKTDWTAPGKPPTVYDRVIERLLTSVRLEAPSSARPAGEH